MEQPLKKMEQGMEQHKLPTNERLGTVEQMEQGLGNSDSNPSPKVRSIFITINNYNEQTENQLRIWVKENCTEWVWQFEEGAEGTPHIQGCMRFKNPRFLKAITKSINESVLPYVHTERTINWEAAVKYCQKDDTQTKTGESNVKDVHRTDKKKMPVADDPMVGLELHPWQNELLDILQEKPDNRKIYWYVDEKGESGKTTFATHICLKHPGEAVYLSGKAADVKNAISSMITKNKIFPKYVMFDLTRSIENYVSYEAIESVKNGIFFSGKYESKMEIFTKPHVIIFANFHPDREKLSADRWIVSDMKCARL